MKTARQSWSKVALVAAVLAAAAFATSGAALLAEPTPAPAAVAPTLRPITATERKSINYLLAQQGKDATGKPNAGPKEDGAWVPQAGPGVTALILKGLLESGMKPDDPVVAKGLAYIETFHQPDGGYYKDSNPTYNTSITLGLFALLPAEAYQPKIKAMQDFLKSIQSMEGKTDAAGKPITKDNPWYGGMGYAGKGARRPDLSNTSFAVEALRDSGLPASDPSIQAALIFVTRCQMNSEDNDQPFAKGQTSGGFIYTSANGGESGMGAARERNGDEVLTAYGSMTYAGLKSFLYAGLTKDDRRVKKAWSWLMNTWTLDKNPGTDQEAGLFYYYHMFAKALRVYGADNPIDAKGVKHDWRKELETKLASIQRNDGSFVNAKDRWMEGNPVLATTYVLLALEEARR